MQQDRFIRMVRYSAWYDLLATWLFVLPWTFTWIYTFLAWTAGSLGLPGAAPELEPMHVLFANLLGSVVVVWALARILYPSVPLGRLDAVARLLFMTWQIHAVFSGASAIILGFTAFELLFGILQLMPVEAQALPVREQGAAA